MANNKDAFINNELLVRSLVVMPDRVTLDDFQKSCEIRSKTVAREMVNYLVDRGIGHLSDGSVVFSIKAKLDTILLAINKGCDPELLSRKLHWKDFELFTSQLLESVGYSYERNVVLTNPRIQIDVIGFYHRIALLVDCKHWMKLNSFNIAKFSSDQTRRAKVFLDKRKYVESAIPVIVILHEYDYNLFNGVPIVPISRFREFLNNFPFFLDRLHLIHNK